MQALRTMSTEMIVETKHEIKQALLERLTSALQN
jgi:hypothetical protein